MNFSSATKLFLVTILFVLFNACGKYEEGPGFSLRTKKARLVGKWIPVKFINESGSQAAGDNEATHEFTNDNTYIISGELGTSTGTWEFINNKASVRTKYEAFLIGEVVNDWEIVRLTNSELWVRNAQGLQINLEPI